MSAAETTTVEGRQLRPFWSRLSVWCLLVFWPLHVAVFHVPIAPQPPSTSTLPPDKTVHLVTYAILAALASWVAWPYGERSRRHGWGWLFVRCAIMLALLAGYAWLDEYTQPWTGRKDDWADWRADVVGAAAGIVAFALLAKQRWLVRWAE